MHLVHSGPVVTHRLASGAQPSGQQVCANPGDISAYAKTKIASLRYRIAVLPFRSAREGAVRLRVSCAKGCRLAERARDGDAGAGCCTQREDRAANGQRGISKTRSYPLRITPAPGGFYPDRFGQIAYTFLAMVGRSVAPPETASARSFASRLRTRRDEGASGVPDFYRASQPKGFAKV
jgi:hypothetical protein